MDVIGTNEFINAGDNNKAIDTWFCHLGCKKEYGTNGPKGWNSWEKYAKRMKKVHDQDITTMS